MRSWWRSMTFGLGVLVGTAPLAQAENFCFNPGTISSVFTSLGVAEKFRKPKKGSCSPINGFDIAGIITRFISGTACLNSAGDTLRVAYLIHPSDQSGIILTPERHVSMSLPYPSLANGTAGIGDNGGTRESSDTAHANPCIPPVIPLP